SVALPTGTNAISLHDALPICFNGTTDASGTYPAGTTVVTWTITDVNGNSTTCTHSVTVNDTQPPTITCPANVVTNTAAGLCNQEISRAHLSTTDNNRGRMTIT